VPHASIPGSEIEDLSMTEHGPFTMPDSTNNDSCPMCGGTTGMQPITGTSPRVQAWSCTVCHTNWAIATVNQLYFDRLAATVEHLARTRSVLRQVITLADDAATLPDKELRDRLLALADRARAP
jgi:hypothetical protein